MEKLTALLSKAAPALLVGVVTSAAALWNDALVIKQEVQTIKTELARHDQEIGRIRNHQDRQNENTSAILGKLDVLVDSAASRKRR